MIDRTLPLLDLHRHLDGSIRLETILDLGRKYEIPLPAEDLVGLKPFVQITGTSPGVLAFFEKFEYMIGVLADYEACSRVAYENVEDAYLEGIDYIELRFSPNFMSKPHHLDPEGVVEAIIEGTERARRNFDIKVNLIGILSRTYGPDQCWKELESLLPYKDQLVALDLAGDEVNYPGTLFIDHFKEGRAAGWHITIHAGEEGGPDNIWQAVEELGAERIGHGVSAAQDPQLMNYLADKGLGVESNLTSNIQTRIIEDYRKHPLKSFLEAGMVATINTDDPGISDIDLKYEYEIAAPAAGLSDSQIQLAQKNALEVAFISDREKMELKEKALLRSEEIDE